MANHRDYLRLYVYIVIYIALGTLWFVRVGPIGSIGCIYVAYYPHTFNTSHRTSSNSRYSDLQAPQKALGHP